MPAKVTALSRIFFIEFSMIVGTFKSDYGVNTFIYTYFIKYVRVIIFGLIFKSYSTCYLRCVTDRFMVGISYTKSYVHIIVINIGAFCYENC